MRLRAGVLWVTTKEGSPLDVASCKRLAKHQNGNAVLTTKDGVSFVCLVRFDSLLKSLKRVGWPDGFTVETEGEDF